MQKISLILLISSLVIILLTCFVGASDLNQFKNYVVYYGKGELNKLKNYDLAIIQPETLNKQQLKELKAAGTKVIVYLSVGEAEESRWWWKDVQKKWIIKQNPNWGSWLINANEKGWRDLLINQVIPSFIEKGFDGFFLDTVDTAVSYPETADGMVELIKEISKVKEDVILVQNRGFSLLDRTGKYIDAMLWEGFAAGFNFMSGQYVRHKVLEERARQYREQALKYNYQILCLGYSKLYDYDTIDYVYQQAEKNNFLAYVTDLYLAQIYDYNSEVERKKMVFNSNNIQGSIKMGNDEFDKDKGSYIFNESQKPGWGEIEVLNGFHYRQALNYNSGIIFSLNKRDNTLVNVVYYDGGLNDVALNLTVDNGQASPLVDSITIGSENRWKVGQLEIPEDVIFDSDAKKPGIQIKCNIQGGKVAYIGNGLDLYGKLYYKRKNLFIEIYNVSLESINNVQIIVKNTNTNDFLYNEVINIEANGTKKVVLKGVSIQELTLIIDPDNVVQEWNEENNIVKIN